MVSKKQVQLFLIQLDVYVKIFAAVVLFFERKDACFDLTNVYHYFLISSVVNVRSMFLCLNILCSDLHKGKQ